MTTYRNEERQSESYEVLVLPMEINEYGDNSAHIFYSEVMDFYSSSFEDYVDVIHPAEAMEV